MIKRAGVAITLAIFIPLFVALGYLYYWIFSHEDFPRFISILIAIGTVALVGAFIAVGIQRFKEIKEESENDLSKY